MLYEFKSRATGTVTMTESKGRQVVEVIGKSPGPKGIITVEQLPAAIAALRAAAHRDRQAKAASPPADPSTDPSAQEDDDARNSVGFSQRAAPLIEMFEAAHAAGKDVTWGV
jgi:hypothetical protein